MLKKLQSWTKINSYKQNNVTLIFDIELFTQRIILQAVNQNMNTNLKPCFKTELIIELKKELVKAKKPQLKTSLQKINPNVTATGNKGQLIDEIAKELYLAVFKLKEQNDGVNRAVDYLKAWFKNQLGICIKPYNLDNIDSLLKMEFKGIEVSKPPRAHKSNQTIVSNIWDSWQSQQYPCICQKWPSQLCGKKIVQNCYKCGKTFHFDCLWGKGKDSKFSETLPECPSCFLTSCIPHRKVEKVLFAGYLPKVKANKIQFLINFNVPQEFKENKKIGLQARCIRIKSQSDNNRFEITWPDNSTVSLNGKKLIEFKLLPANSALKRRSDEEVVLDKSHTCCGAYESLLIEERHQYESSQAKYEYAEHFLMIFAVNHQTEIQLLDQFKSSRLSIPQSKEILKNYLSSNNSNDIQVEKLNVSLKCPMFFTKISIPVRSKHCSTHFQPFDLKNFLTINRTVGKGSAQKYKCPICKRRAYDLIVDEYLLDLLKACSNGENVSQITFRADGEPHFEEQDISDEESQQEAPNVQQSIEQILPLQNPSEQEIIVDTQNHDDSLDIIEESINKSAEEKDDEIIFIESEDQELRVSKEDISNKSQDKNLSKKKSQQDISKQDQQKNLTLSNILGKRERDEIPLKLFTEISPIEGAIQFIRKQIKKNQSETIIPELSDKKGPISLLNGSILNKNSLKFQNDTNFNQQIVIYKGPQTSSTQINQNLIGNDRNLSVSLSEKINPINSSSLLQLIDRSRDRQNDTQNKDLSENDINLKISSQSKPTKPTYFGLKSGSVEEKEIEGKSLNILALASSSKADQIQNSVAQTTYNKERKNSSMNNLSLNLTHLSLNQQVQQVDPNNDLSQKKTKENRNLNENLNVDKKIDRNQVQSASMTLEPICISSDDQQQQLAQNIIEPQQNLLKPRPEKEKPSSSLLLKHNVYTIKKALSKNAKRNSNNVPTDNITDESKNRLTHCEKEREKEKEKQIDKAREREKKKTVWQNIVKNFHNQFNSKYPTQQINTQDKRLDQSKNITQQLKSYKNNQSREYQNYKQPQISKKQSQPQSFNKNNHCTMNYHKSDEEEYEYEFFEENPTPNNNQLQLSSPCQDQSEEESEYSSVIEEIQVNAPQTSRPPVQRRNPIHQINRILSNPSKKFKPDNPTKQTSNDSNHQQSSSLQNTEKNHQEETIYLQEIIPSVNNTFDNPINLESQGQECIQNTQNQQPSPIQIEIPKITVNVNSYESELKELRQEMEKNRQTAERYNIIYKTTLIKEEDQKMFYQMLEQLNNVNNLEVF